MSDPLLELAERHGASPDKGRAFFVELAAKHVAIVRGLGYHGVYLGGHMPAETFGEILDLAATFADDWRALVREIRYPLPGEFYLFEEEPDTGLSSERVNAAYLQSKRRRRTDLRVPLSYRFSRRVHEKVFASDAPLRPAARSVYRGLDSAPRPVRRAAHALEQAAKVPLFSCRDCGDCSLAEIAYVCPESQCAKNQRNGPCGGTRDGLCEVYDTECIWSQAYERLKAYGEEEEMLDGPVVVKDNALAGTSAWANTFLGRDHQARAPKEEQEQEQTSPPGAAAGITSSEAQPRARRTGPRSADDATRHFTRRYEDVSYASLEEKLQAVGSAVEMARNSQIGPYVYPAVPSEFSNWRDEQVAWRETAALFDQSHHMTDLYVEGPDVIRLLSDLGVNTFQNFAVDKAKQFVACNHDGYVIGDGILFFLSENRVSLVGRPSAHNWVQYHAETGDYDVTVERDERTAANPTGRRKIYRFQVQGPTAMDVLEEATGGALPEIKFFNMGEITIAGHAVRALHHGMSGVPGLELFGPWEEREDVRAAIVDAGKDHGLRQVGSRVYATNTLESGWIPCPLPAVFTGDELRAYREWLPGDGYEATGSLGGSFYTDDIADYYLTPHEAGYGPFVKFDHDFVGREALEQMGDEPSRRKVTLAWNGEDVAHAMQTLFERGDPVKYIDLPLSNYSTWPNDRVTKDGELVGVSTFSGYSYNERSMLSLAVVDANVAVGTEVTLVWGEENGGSSKPVVERHRQAEIRAIVSPCPYSEVARTSYAEGWRTKAGVA